MTEKIPSSTVARSRINVERSNVTLDDNIGKYADTSEIKVITQDTLINNNGDTIATVEAAANMGIVKLNLYIFKEKAGNHKPAMRSTGRGIQVVMKKEVCRVEKKLRKLKVLLTREVSEYIDKMLYFKTQAMMIEDANEILTTYKQIKIRYTNIENKIFDLKKRGG